MPGREAMRHRTTGSCALQVRPYVKEHAADKEKETSRWLGNVESAERIGVGTDLCRHLETCARIVAARDGDARIGRYDGDPHILRKVVADGDRNASGDGARRGLTSERHARLQAVELQGRKARDTR